MKLLSITTTASTTDAVLFGYFRQRLLRVKRSNYGGRSISVLLILGRVCLVLCIVQQDDILSSLATVVETKLIEICFVSSNLGAVGDRFKLMG